MRTQRRPGITITVVSVVTTRDRVGEETTVPKLRKIRGAIFEPERVVERVGDAAAPVLQPAFFNVPGIFTLDQDDVVRVGAVEWQVVGGSTVWLNRTKIPVEQARAL